MIIANKEKVGMIGTFRDDIVPEFACIVLSFYEKSLGHIKKRPEDASVESTAADFLYEIVKFSIENAGTGKEIEPQDFFS